MKERNTNIDELLKNQSDGKVSFGRLIFSGNKGPYIVAFEDSITRTYAEMNALDFKNVNINDIKTETVPLWEAGAKSQTEIDALPKLNIKKHKEKKVKEKETKKTARAEKMKETKAKNAVKKLPKKKGKK